MKLLEEWLTMKAKQQNKSDEDIEFIIKEVKVKCKELGLKIE